MLEYLVANVEVKKFDLERLQKKLQEAKQTEDQETGELESKIKKLKSGLDRAIEGQGEELHRLLECIDFSWAQSQDFTIFEPKAIYHLLRLEADSSDYMDRRKLMNINESGIKRFAEHLATIEDQCD